MSGGGRNPETGAIDPNLAFKTIRIDQSNLGSLLFRDIQAITIEGSPLFIDVVDATTCFKFNFDVNALLAATDQLNLRISEVPIDLSSGKASGFDFTQGPFSSDADIEKLDLTSTGPSANFLNQLSVGSDLKTLIIRGDQDFTLTTDLGEGEYGEDTACGPNDNDQVNRIDASLLAADLSLIYTSAVNGVVDVEGAQGTNKLIFGSSIGSATRFDVFINNNPALGPGNDTVVTGPGSDTVVSGIGNDSVNVGDGNNSVDAGEGNDTVIAGNGSDSVQGGTGDDLLTVGDGNNTVDANAGNDTVTAGSGNDSVLGGIGNDSICVDGGNNTVVAGDGRDTVGAGSGNDSVLGGEGNDLIAVGEGNNTVDGGTGEDTILAGNGNDSLVGGGGFDVIYAGGGNNVVKSGTEDDLIQIGNGRDVVLAGLGNDTVVMRAEALTNLDQISGDESLIWDFAPGGPAPAGYGTEDYIWFTEGGTIGTSETLGVQNIEGFKLWNLPSFDISPVVTVCDVEYGGTDPTMGMAADYTIVLSQEVVSKSNDIQPINPAGFQNQRVFTIDAEDANRVDNSGNKVTFVDVTVDLTNLEQGDGFGNRTGFVYKGQDDLRQGDNIELIILDQAMVSETLVIDFNETTFQDSYIPDDCGPVGLQTNFLQFVGQDTFVADADDLINIDDSDRIILSAATGRFDVTFNIELTTDWLEEQMEDTGYFTNRMEDYVITPDASLFPGATLNLYIQPLLAPQLDIGGPGGRLFVYTSGMLDVNYFDLDTGAAINFADLPTWVVQKDGLFFTQNADDIQGTDCDDTIYAFQVSDLNAADSVNGGGGFDTVEFDFGVFNSQAKTSTSTRIGYDKGVCPEIFTSFNFDINGLTLSEQLNFVDFNNVEEFIFDPKNQDGVRFLGFNLGGDQKEEIDLEDLDVLRTSPPSSGNPNSGNDLLYLDDRSGDAGSAYGFANLAVFTYDGNDTIFLESGSYWVESGNGNDVVLAPGHQGEDPVAVQGMSKGDTVNAGTGNDFVFLGAGDDFVLAGDGNDTVTTNLGNDYVDGGIGDDVISAGEGNNTVVDLDGNNVITAGAGNDSILTGAGNDSINAGDGANSVAAGEGDNIVCSGTGNDTVTTGSGNDTITTDGGDDSIEAGDGNNSILAGSGNDTVGSGSGNDTIDAGSGNDSIVSGAGNDSILFPGDDEFGTGDTVLAGAGIDTVEFSITTDTDLAPRAFTGGTPTPPIVTGSVPGWVDDTTPLLSGIEQFVVNFNEDDVTLRLANSVVGQIGDLGLNGAGTIKVVANAQGADAIISAGDTDIRQGGAGYFNASQVFDVTLNDFFTEAEFATTVRAPGPNSEDANTWISATAGDGGDPGSQTMRRQLINALFFDDFPPAQLGLGNKGAGAIGGSADDIFTIGSLPEAPTGDNSYGFVSLQGNGGGDTFNLSGAGPLQNPDQNDRYVEFIRYVTAQDGSDAGVANTYDEVLNFDKGKIFLTFNIEEPSDSALGRRQFTDVVTVVNGESDPIDNNRVLGDDGLGITDITGDKLIIEGSLYDGITGSNGNFLLDRFTVNKGFNLDDHEALFLTNPAGVTDDLITNFDYVASRANVLAGGINADNDDGGLIIIQGISKSAVYFFQNETGASGAGASVEASELRLLSVVDVPTLYADDFLFNPQAQINI
jgi:Ca2+-binding RTX toxin-like protein